MTTSIDELHEKARCAIEAGEGSLRRGIAAMRDAAAWLAEAKAKGATQQQSADAIGKSQAWVSDLLKWRRGEYKGSGPFARILRGNQAADKTAGTKRSSRVATADLRAREFDDVVKQLKKLRTKPIDALSRTTHDPADLERLADFLREVAKAMRAAQMKDAA